MMYLHLRKFLKDNGGRVGSYLDPTTTYIRYKMTYTHGGNNGTDYSRFLGTPYSPFIKQEIYGNNSVLLESISEIGILAFMLTNVQLNDADKRGLSPSFAFDFSTNAYFPSATAGHQINLNTGLSNVTFEYAIPLIGLLGSGTNKMIPLGAMYGLRYELTLDDFTKYTKLQTATAANKISGIFISEFEFVGNIIELSPEAEALVNMANPDKIHIRSQTYRQASASLPASSGSSTNDLVIGIRVSSLKSVFMVCSPSDAVEGKYAGVNPNLDQGTSLIIAGQQYPKFFGIVLPKVGLVY